MTVRIGVLVAGRYRVERQIGSGGMGAVWLARDERLDRLVALKRAHPAADERRLRELSREARIAGGIEHPRVVLLYDLVTEGAETWLVMEYVPSRDLADVIASDGVLAPEKVAHIGRQLADALAAVHARGIVHGDVKPGNVLITESGDAKLTDFGVSRALWTDETVSDSGLFRGTPAYVAPEVARGAKPLPAADVFSLGATLFTAAEGSSPLGSGDSPLTVVWRSASGHVAAPSAPGRLGAALSAMLRLEADDRPDAAEAGRLLELGDDAGPVPRGREKRRFGRTALAAAAAALVLVVAGGTMIFRPDRSSPNPSQETAAKGPSTPVSAIGDARTADPCGLIDPASFRRFGTTELSTDYGNFDRCDVLILHQDDEFADVKVELDNGPAPEAGSRDRVERRGPVGIIREPLGDDECDQTLTLADGHIVAVTAQLTGKGKIDLCAAATVAADYAAAKLVHGAVPRRARPLPAASLAKQDACGLLTKSVLTRVHAGRADPGFARWGCRWAATGDTDIQLRFDRNGPLGKDDGHRVRLAGRSAFIQAGGDGQGTCVAQVVHRTYVDTSGQKTAEIVYLVVSGKSAESRLCTEATSLASAASARLPAT